MDQFEKRIKRAMFVLGGLAVLVWTVVFAIPFIK